MMSFSYHMEWKHSSKQAVPIIYTLEKKFFAAAAFEGLWVVSFQTEWKKIAVYFGLYESSLHFWKREDQMNTVYVK